MLALPFSLLHPIPPPPYVLQQTEEVFRSANEPRCCVLGATFFVTDKGECRAYKLPSLELLWSITIPKGDQGGNLLAVDGTLFMSTASLKDGQESHIYALDADKGEVKWNLPCNTYSSDLAYSDGTLFASLEDGSVSAISPITHLVAWTTHFESRLPGNSFDQWAHPIEARNGVVAVSCGGSGHFLNSRTGAQLWRSDTFRDAVVTAKTAWVFSGGYSFGSDLSTGTQRWWRRAPAFNTGTGASLNGLFIRIEDEEVYAIDPETGRLRWAHDLGSDSPPTRYCYGAIIGNTIFARGRMKGVICGADGKLIWQGSTLGMFPKPYWTDSKYIVCFDGHSLTRYGHDRELPIPKTRTGRLALAANLVAHLERLDQVLVGHLRDLGDDAFEPLMRSFIKASKLKDKAGDRGSYSAVWQAMTPVEESLLAVTTPLRAKDIMHELDAAGPQAYCRPLLLRLLARVGNPKSSTPYFLRELERPTRKEGMFEASPVRIARDYLKDSRDPRAVRWFMRALQDPKGRDEWSAYAAYTNLARTGGREAVKAVLAQRRDRKLLRPLAERALEPPRPLPGVKPFKAKKMLEDGRTFKLFPSDVLGQRADLWIAERIGGVWKPARFTGVSGAGSFSWRDMPPPSGTLGGKNSDELEGGAWVDMVDDPSIARDSDADGLTDLVEERLGTDKDNPDTDGDGTRDSVDPWPNAPPRKLTDGEQVLAAVFEATFHFDKNDVPALLTSPGALKPFEMPGRLGPVIWAPDKGDPNEHPLNKCWDRGAAFISFGRSASLAKSWEDRLILWNSTKTEATVQISVYFGGLDGTTSEAVVRKFGRNWIVTSLKAVSVS